MAASQYKLDNLWRWWTATVCRFQGSTEGCDGARTARRALTSFGWNVLSVDSNCMEELCSAWAAAKSL